MDLGRPFGHGTWTHPDGLTETGTWYGDTLDVSSDEELQPPIYVSESDEDT